jgi:hypothetical protein
VRLPSGRAEDVTRGEQLDGDAVGDLDDATECHLADAFGRGEHLRVR